MFNIVDNTKCRVTRVINEIKKLQKNTKLSIKLNKSQNYREN